MNFITGEKIIDICDHYIGKLKHTNDNLKRKNNFKSKFIVLNKLNSKFDNKPLILMNTQILENFQELINKLIFLKNPFILIFHNSDFNFDKKYCLLFNKLTLLKKIYTQNLNVIYKNTYPIPIGLANSYCNHGNLEVFETVYNLEIKKNKEIYFFFNIYTNLNLRNNCKNVLLKKNLVWNQEMNYYDYLQELKKHKYCICPEGNGIDTHRFWECLYLDVIPICKKNILFSYYSQYFPIIILDNWSDLSVNNLKYELNKNKDMLNLDNIKFY